MNLIQEKNNAFCMTDHQTVCVSKS